MSQIVPWSIKVPWEPFKAGGNCGSLHLEITKADLEKVELLEHSFSYAYFFFLCEGDFMC